MAMILDEAVSADKDLPADEGRRVTAILREELARRRISRQYLADHAGISISTLEKALSGRRAYTLATLIRLEAAIGVPLRAAQPAPAPAPSAASVASAIGLAPGDLGYYSRPSVAPLEGSYVTLRPSFSGKGSIFAYRTLIAWDEHASHLVFRESDRSDAAFTQEGVVSVPNQSGYVYLVTNKHGQFRLITVSRPTIDGEMHGVLASLIAGRGAQLTPVATPIVLVPAARFKEPAFGRVSPGDAMHGAYAEYLRRTIEEPFALFIS
ncbi:helix-turn-helix transcriptional regulator [Starkeya sp. ORNL1]|uniref:helix-turn-helix domain-containing protein n=1 Tax=Starkeya sp. ORNL1 TaxID=2709380 RepID=UPI001FEE1538|nr:helix-turn-helix transcriptional regulator [Starkeya sp. ORNL1]